MLQDFTDYILLLSTEYTKITVEEFTHDGVTYKGNSVSSKIKGSLQPLTSEDRIEILTLGHSIEGKKVFYLPTSEGILHENDILMEQNGTEWVVTPKSSDWSNEAGYIKYWLERRVLQ